jgi:hypothetical protein
MKLDAHYFLAKLGPIPAEMWTVNSLSDCDGRRCLLGHLGVTDLRRPTPEAVALQDLLAEHSIVAVNLNDGYCGRYSDAGFGPRERVIMALRDVAAGTVRPIRAR